MPKNNLHKVLSVASVTGALFCATAVAANAKDTPLPPELVPTEVYLYEKQGPERFGFFEESWDALGILKQGDKVEVLHCSALGASVVDAREYYENYCYKHGDRNPFKRQGVIRRRAEGLYSIHSGYSHRIGTFVFVANVASIIFNEREPGLLTVLSQHTESQPFEFPKGWNTRVTQILKGRFQMLSAPITSPHRTEGESDAGEWIEFDPSCG